MVKKSIELVGTSNEDFSDAIEVAIKEAAESLRGLEWVKVIEYTAKVDNNKITQYQARLKVYFDVER
jgi:flavin-binding protein dodecin